MGSFAPRSPRPARSPQRHALRSSILLLLLIIIGGGGLFFRPHDGRAFVSPRTIRHQGGGAPPPEASISVKVQVPASMRSSPFNVERYLTVPPDFSISVYARIPGARFMALAPNGDLLVSRPGAGRVVLVRPNGGGDPLISDFVTGLRKPHDIVFHTIDGVTYLYIAESHQINRYVYTFGDTTGKNRQIVVTGLPDDSSPELGGAHGHELKNIALDANHKLYVSSASATNSDPSDATSDPPRASILQYDANGANQHVFARGLRNAEGLAILPGTNELWVVVNNRDNIAYPFHHDWNGDGTDDYGKVMQSYVDDHPPDEFTRVRDGGNYGWPYANPNPDYGPDNMPFDLDVQNNPDGSRGGVESFDRITKGIPAHSAPLGLTFTHTTAFPAPYRPGAVVALHGSWNRALPTGYKVVYFPWDTTAQSPGAQLDLVRGWLSDGSYWGRPVDAIVDGAGNLLISDDHGGAIYKLTYTASAPPAVTSFTLINADTDQTFPGYDPLSNGATIDFAALGTRNLSIRANMNPARAAAGSVLFGYDGNPNYRSDNDSPFTIAGEQNNGSDYLAWTPAAGTHSLTATPYTGAHLSGAAGTSLSITFTVVDDTTTPPPPLPPAAPSSLAAAAASTTRINLSWVDNASNEDGFRIERSLNGTSFTPIATVGANVRSYADTGLVRKKTYYYRVCAYNAAGASAYTKRASARTLSR